MGTFSTDIEEDSASDIPTDPTVKAGASLSFSEFRKCSFAYCVGDGI